MANKPKCSQCANPVLSKGLCSTCYGKEWRAARREGREMVIPSAKPIVEGELLETVGETALAVIEPPIAPPSTHLVATDPSEMKAAQGDLKTWLEQKLTVLEHDIVEANAALNEARRNGWNTSALTSARNRAVDDETFYNKVLAAVESGHTIIPDFPVDVFAVRLGIPDKRNSFTFQGSVSSSDTFLGHPAASDCAPAGMGEFRNPQPATLTSTTENRAVGAQERGESRWRTRVTRTGQPVGPIVFPHFSARSRVMAATARAMEQKFFDQIAVCRPLGAIAETSTRRAVTTTRAGDPLIIGQVLRKRIGGGPQKCVSFIIAWHLNLNEL